MLDRNSAPGYPAANVALCYRIAGHVKQAAKEVKGIGPGTFGCPGLFLGRRAAHDERLEDPHEAGA